MEIVQQLTENYVATGIALVLIVVTSIVFKWYYDTFLSFRDIPTPKTHPLWGNLPDIKRSALKKHNYMLWNGWAKQYGKLYRVIVPFIPPFVWVTDGEVIRKLFTDIETYIPTPSFSAAFGAVAADSLLIISGHQWKVHRKVITAAFAPIQLRYALEVTEKMVGYVMENFEVSAKDPKSPGVYINEEFSKLALDIIGVVAFGHDFGTIKNGSPFYKDLKAIMAGVEMRMNMPKFMWKWLLSDTESFYGAIARMRNVPIQMLEDRRKKSETAEDDTQTVPRRDVMARILELGKLESDPISEEDIINEIMLFFLAGHETTANTLSWVIINLARRPDLVKILRQEVDQILTPDVQVTLELLPKFKYLDAIIKETFRLTPTVPASARTATKDVEIMGKKFPKGTTIGLNMYGVHHDPELYPNPEEFNPDRWINLEKQPAFFPFGDGPRICVGQKLAMLELKYTIAKVIQKFDFWLAPDVEIDPQHTITCGPNSDLLVKVSYRS